MSRARRAGGWKAGQGQRPRWPVRRRSSPPLSRLQVQLALSLGDLPAAEEKRALLRTLRDTGTRHVHASYRYPGAAVHLVEADVAVAVAEHREAEECVHRALAIIGADLPLVTVDALELLAVVLAERNRAGDAARLLGATQRFRDDTGYRFRFPLRHLQIKALRPQLDADQLEAGARLGLDEALALARGSRGKRGRPTSGWDSLTPTERRVEHRRHQQSATGDDRRHCRSAEGPRRGGMIKGRASRLTRRPILT